MDFRIPPGVNLEPTGMGQVGWLDSQLKLTQEEFEILRGDAPAKDWMVLKSLEERGLLKTWARTSKGDAAISRYLDLNRPSGLV